jgi:hypothetical protein
MKKGDDLSNYNSHRDKDPRSSAKSLNIVQTTAVNDSYNTISNVILLSKHRMISQTYKSHSISQRITQRSSTPQSHKLISIETK